MENRAIAIPQSIRREAAGMAAQIPTVPTVADRADFLATVPNQFRTEAEEHWSEAAQDATDYQKLLVTEMRALKDNIHTLLVFSKPILSIPEAAEMLGKSPKRLVNIISAEKAKLGRLPDFACDAGGKIQRCIIRDELIAWVRTRKRGRCRSSLS